MDNYVYIPYYLLLLLTGLAFIGLEHLAWHVIRGIDRRTRPRAKKAAPTATILRVEDFKKEQSGS